MDLIVRPGRAAARAALLAFGWGVVAGIGAAPFVLAQDSSPAVEAAAVPDLSASFPATLDGQPLEVVTFGGAEWLARQDPSTPEGSTVAERTEELVASVGGTIDELTVASALHEPSEGDH